MGRRGGAVALIYRSSLKCRFASFDFLASTFELLPTPLSINSSSFLLLVIDPPPLSNINLFLDEFATLLEVLATTPSKLLIVADFNIHIDDLTNQVSRKFTSVTDSFDLLPHVDQPTHVGGHSLDVVLSRSADNTVIDCFLSDAVSDHWAVHWLVKAHRPVRPTKSVQFRKLNSIDGDAFRSDLASLTLVTDPANDFNTLFFFNTMLVYLLSWRSTLRSSNEPSQSDQTTPGTMRTWKVTRLTIDKDLMPLALDNLRELITQTKIHYLNSRIAENKQRQSLFKLVDSLLLIKPGLSLLCHNSLGELAVRFSHFFMSKIAPIRTSLELTDFPHSPELRLPLAVFSSFSPVSIHEVCSIILSCPTKSSPLDQVPTFLIKQYLTVLATSITRLINDSLVTGVFPSNLKLAYVTPL